jgi:hypothetical protein
VGASAEIERSVSPKDSPPNNIPDNRERILPFLLSRVSAWLWPTRPFLVLRVVDHSLRTMFIRSSILRTMEGRLKLRLCSILSEVRTNAARDSAFIFGRSTSIFLTMSCFNLLLLRVMMPTTSGGNIANSRIELTAKHPFCPSMLHGPILRNRSMLFQPKGSAVSSPFFSRLSR